MKRFTVNYAVLLAALLGAVLAPHVLPAQAAKGVPPPGAPPPPVTYRGLVPGISTARDVLKTLGKPAHEARWYSWKMLYPAAKDGHYDAIHMRSSAPTGVIGNIEAFTIPAGYESWPLVRAKLGEPEFRLEYSTQSLADYSERGVRFTFDGDGNTIGVAYFPHGFPRVHSGERSFLSLRDLRQGPQPRGVTAKNARDRVALLCGAAQADITPQGDDWLGPRKFTVHDPLYARAVVFAKGDLKIAIVGGDIFGMLKSEIDTVEARLREAGIAHLLVSMSHNHTAGDPIGIYGFYPEKYVAHIQEGIVEAVTKALHGARPVGELKVGSDELSLAGARVEGLFRNARNPGLVDPQIAVIQAVDEGGRPIVSIVHFACHVEGIGTPGGKPLEVTADFPGYLCRALREKTGAQAVFLNGAVGGMVSGDTKARTHAEAEVAGKRLAAAALRLLATAVPTARELSFERHRLEIPVTNPRMRLFMKMTEKRRKAYRGRVVTEMFHVRLGDAELLTIPSELLPELSFEILARMKGYPRMIVGLANDQLGYIIPAYDFRDGVYEESMSLGPAAGPVVLGHALRIVE